MFVRHASPPMARRTTAAETIGIGGWKERCDATPVRASPKSLTVPADEVIPKVSLAIDPSASMNGTLLGMGRGRVLRRAPPMVRHFINRFNTVRLKLEQYQLLAGGGFFLLPRGSFK